MGRQHGLDGLLLFLVSCVVSSCLEKVSHLTLPPKHLQTRGFSRKLQNWASKQLNVFPNWANTCSWELFREWPTLGSVMAQNLPPRIPRPQIHSLMIIKRDQPQICIFFAVPSSSPCFVWKSPSKPFLWSPCCAHYYDHKTKIGSRKSWQKCKVLIIT